MIPARDHLGKNYRSMSDMARAYGKNPHFLFDRLNAGMSLEEALTTPKIVGNSSVCKDHLGNKFHSYKEMCKFHGLSYATFYSRLASGCSVIAAISKKKIRGARATKDHLGNEFPSIAAMCRHYNIDHVTYAARRKAGMSLEEALTNPKIVGNSSVCKDHLGTKFPSIAAMCRHYNIDHVTYATRRKAGMSLEEALTTPICKGICCKDPQGREFASYCALAKYYKVEYSSLHNLIKQGLTIAEALEQAKREE